MRKGSVSPDKQQLGCQVVVFEKLGSMGFSIESEKNSWWGRPSDGLKVFEVKKDGKADENKIKKGDEIVKIEHKTGEATEVLYDAKQMEATKSYDSYDKWRNVLEKRPLTITFSARTTP